ncbi:uncharacterized protein LOC115331510 [Ixodes scapularis]|uniref:uncharacterized protein LOC115331510 n=1 Tax=Ixodes scapularis TaxID=6945 RepID=UPI001C38FF65|nr:uncharacterized protein LOC115331510 [Ixodes scapularis]
MAASERTVDCRMVCSSDMSPSNCESPDMLHALFVQCIESYVAQSGSDTDWALIARATAAMILRSRRRRHCREWIRFRLRSRETFGEFHHLVRDMRLDNGSDFFQYFRMTRQRFDQLLALVGPQLQREATPWRKPISPAERLSLTIRYLAHGSSQRICASCYRIGRSTTSLIIGETCRALHRVLDPLYRTPPNMAQWERMAGNFARLWNFLNCVGAVDGKHVTIQALPSAGSDTYNYKGFHSIVLLESCDAAYKFTLVDVGQPGRFSDGENTFGILVARWRIFRQPIQASEENLEAIVWACVSLHNYLRTCDENEQGERRYCPAGYADQEGALGDVVLGQWRAEVNDGGALVDVGRTSSNMYNDDAKKVRQTYARYFCCPAGEVTWQYKNVYKGLTPAVQAPSCP